MAPCLAASALISVKMDVPKCRTLCACPMAMGRFSTGRGAHHQPAGVALQILSMAETYPVITRVRHKRLGQLKGANKFSFPLRDIARAVSSVFLALGVDLKPQRACSQRLGQLITEIDFVSGVHVRAAPQFHVDGS